MAKGENRDIAVGSPRYDPRDASKAKVYVEEFPFEMTKDDLKRGQERYTIYCAVCHGALGNGEGKIWERGYLKPTSFHTVPVAPGEQAEVRDGVWYERIGSFTGKKGFPRMGVPLGYSRGYGIIWDIKIPLRDVPGRLLLRGHHQGLRRHAQLLRPDPAGRPVADHRLHPGLADEPVCGRNTTARRREEPSGSGREAVSTDPAATHGEQTPSSPPAVPQPDWANYRQLALSAAVIGFAIYLGAGLLNFAAAHDDEATKNVAQQRFATAYLSGFIYWISIPLGGMALLMIGYLAKSSWGLLLRRPMEAAIRTLPLWVLLFVPLVVFAWNDHYSPYFWTDPWNERSPNKERARDSRV